MLSRSHSKLLQGVAQGLRESQEGLQSVLGRDSSDVLLFTSSTTFGTETPSDTPDVEQSVYECCYDLLRYNHEQVVVEESENMTLVASKPVPWDYFYNGVLRMAQDIVLEPNDIENVKEFFHNHNVTQYMWVLSDRQRKTNERALLEAGYTLEITMPGMAIDLSKARENDTKPVPVGLSLSEVESDADLSDYLAVFCEAFETPNDVEPQRALLQDVRRHWRVAVWHVIARLDGNPVGCGTVQLNDNGEATFYSIAVLPVSRGKGVGGHIVKALSDIVRGRNVTRGYLVSSPMGLRVYQRMGFETVSKLNFFVSPPPHGSPMEEAH